MFESVNEPVISLGVSTVEIVLSVKTKLFFFSVEIFKIETFQSRLWRVEIFVEIVKSCQDALRLSRRSRDLLRPFESENDEKSQRIEKSRWENAKSMHFSIEIETNCRETLKFSDLDEFLDLDWDFWSGHWCQDKIEKSLCQDEIEKSQSQLRFLDCWDALFDAVKIETLDRDTIKTNQDPQA